MEFSKLDPTTLQVVKPVETIQETKEYKLEFLRQQELDILKQKNDFVEARNKELEEVRTLIVEAEKLGIKTETEIALANEIIKEEK